MGVGGGDMDIFWNHTLQFIVVFENLLALCNNFSKFIFVRHILFDKKQ